MGFAGGEAGTASQGPETQGWDTWDSGSYHQKLQVFPVDSFWAASNPGLHMLSSQEDLSPCVKPRTTEQHTHPSLANFGRPPTPDGGQPLDLPA